MPGTEIIDAEISMPIIKIEPMDTGNDMAQTELNDVQVLSLASESSERNAENEVEPVSENVNHTHFYGIESDSTSFIGNETHNISKYENKNITKI